MAGRACVLHMLAGCINKRVGKPPDVSKPGAKQSLSTGVSETLHADWGGGIAWRTTDEHPEMVERLIVMGSAHPELFLKNMDAEQKKRRASISKHPDPRVCLVKRSACSAMKQRVMVAGVDDGHSAAGATSVSQAERLALQCGIHTAGRHFAH